MRRGIVVFGAVFGVLLALAASPALASSVQVGSAPTLTSTGGGVQHVRYTVTFTTSATGALADGDTITISAPAGTVFANNIGVHNDTTGGSFSAGSTMFSNGGATVTLTLCCGQTVGANHTVTVTFVNVTNPAAGGPYTIGVATSKDTDAAQSPGYTLTPPQTVSSLNVSPSSTAGGVPHVRYAVAFTASSTGGLTDEGTITLAAPAGTTFTTNARLHNDTTGTTMIPPATLSNGDATLTLKLCCSQLISSGDRVTVTAAGVTNPPAGGPYSIDVSTSSDPAPVTTPGYTLSAPQSVTDATAVTVTPGQNGTVADSFSFRTSAAGGLVDGGAITITGPAGTVMPTSAQISDETARTPIGNQVTRSNGDATITLTLAFGSEIASGHLVKVTLPGITNPASGAGPFEVSTTSDPNPVTTPPPVDPPVIGETATAAVKKGKVRVRVPGKKGFVTLTEETSIPVGSVLDTRKGQVALTFATNAGGGTQSGSFSQGQFKVQQTRKNPLTTMSMVGGGLDACKAKLPKGGARKAPASAARKRRRSLFANANGRFRTRGRNSSATVRGTRWRMTDTCKGTKTAVARGSVVVRDFTLRKKVRVKAGGSYFARAPLRKKKKR
jgi:hypothetical protein